MACAGIIAASHTTDSAAGLDTLSGVISVAPSTIILPVKIFSDFTPVVEADSVANAINYCLAKRGRSSIKQLGYFLFLPARYSSNYECNYQRLSQWQERKGLPNHFFIWKPGCRLNRIPVLY